jgi:hypothetical protein
MSEPADVSSVKLTNSSIDENRAALLGSASWNGADAYKIGDELYERATAFFAAVKWDVLASISSSLRNGIPCEFGEKFSIGHFNMVQRIVFADGISWVARLRLPLLKAVFGDREALDNASTLKVEIASMKFFKYVMFGLRWSCADLVPPREGPKPLFLFQKFIVTALTQLMMLAPRTF